MKPLKKWLIAFLIVISLSEITGCGSSSYITTGVQYSNPPWAPPYSAGVRYYYMPDIETYYDLSNHDFIYLDNGQWLFSSVLPPMYSGYDLYNGFIVTLNVGIYQPWLHHQDYVSHYPRYYYRNVYRDPDIKTIRGFNENARKPIYWKQEDREKINIQKRDDNTVRPREFPQQPQNTHYYGKEIGKPVKVKPNMKESKQGNRKNGRRQ